MQTEEPPLRQTWLDRVETWVSGLSIGIAAVLVVVAVFLRYFFAYSISAFDEITIYLVIWGTFVAASRLLRRKGHITIDILIVHLPARGQLALQAFAYLLGAGFCALVAWYGAMLCWQSYTLGATSISALRVPLWLPQAAVPVGGALLTWRFVQHFVANVKALRRPPEPAADRAR
jgi:C4-dicarboxylate transporter DctQ subunit